MSTCIRAQLSSLKVQKDAIIERVMRFAVDFVIARAKEEETAMEDGQFHVEVLSFLVKNLVAKDRGVRLRAAELATDIMEGLPETFQLDEDLADEYKDAMAQVRSDASHRPRIQPVTVILHQNHNVSRLKIEVPQ